MSGSDTRPDPWMGERVIGVAEARRWLADSAPWLADSSIVEFGSGWDNAAFLVDDELVVRFPRRELAVELLETEWKILPKLAGILPLAVPRPEISGVSTDERAWPFVGYRVLTGQTACRVDPGPATRAAHAEVLGHFLGTLHAITPSHAKELGAEPDRWRRSEAGYRRERALEALAEAVTEDWLDASLAKGLGRRLARSEGVEARFDCLCHGDLYARHLLVEGERLTGIIDWGDLHLGDPSVDVAVALTYLPPGALDAFQDAYGRVRPPLDDAHWRLAELRAVGHSLALLAYGVRGGEPELAREALRSLLLLAR